VVDLKGRVAVVTGAGRGIGRAHALHLAGLGASVVVNDLGVAINGGPEDGSPAHDVVAEIEAAGGAALASTDSVASAEGGAAVVAAAVDGFGHIDLLVHNAGIVGAAPVATQAWDEVEAVLAVHLLGSYHIVRPAWPLMAEQGYGRIVLTTSGAIFGHPMVHAYAAAKAGVVGLTRSLAMEAAMGGLDIKVNSVAPIGATRMARDEQKARWGDLMDPDAVSAAVAYLCSEGCAVTGETFHAGGGHIGRIALGITRGWAKGEPGVTADEVGQHIDEAMDLSGLFVPPNTNSMTDFIFSVATGRTDALSGAEVLPTEARR
jgi:NAD(P)-dependent dehydrogenase (short-subunit alcohol dehydrogenase family)